MFRISIVALMAAATVPGFGWGGDAIPITRVPGPQQVANTMNTASAQDMMSGIFDFAADADRKAHINRADSYSHASAAAGWTTADDTSIAMAQCITLVNNVTFGAEVIATVGSIGHATVAGFGFGTVCFGAQAIADANWVWDSGNGPEALTSAIMITPHFLDNVNLSTLGPDPFWGEGIAAGVFTPCCGWHSVASVLYLGGGDFLLQETLFDGTINITTGNGTYVYSDVCFDPCPPARTTVALRHDGCATQDQPGGVSWIHAIEGLGWFEVRELDP